MTLPSTARIASCGILARFSAQSVSITPASGRSTTRASPISCQNARSCGHICSGVSGELNQRSLPSRSIFVSPAAVVAELTATAVVPAAEGEGAVAPAWNALALTL